MAELASSNRRRFGRVVRIACAAVLVMSIVAWVFSVFRWGKYSYSWLVNTGPGQFDYEVRTTAAWVGSGQLEIGWVVETSGDRFPLPRHKAMSRRDNGFHQFQPEPKQVRWFMWQSDAQEHERLVAGLGWNRFQMSSVGIEALTITVPFWLLCLLAATPLILHALPAQRRARRKAAGLCVRCAYSRNGLTDAQACPECGHAAK